MRLALALLLPACALAEPVRVDALVVIDGQALHLPAAICTLDEPAVYSREDGRLTLRIAGITCADKIFGDGFDLAGPLALATGTGPRRQASNRARDSPAHPDSHVAPQAAGEWTLYRCGPESSKTLCPAGIPPVGLSGPATLPAWKEPR